MSIYLVALLIAGAFFGGLLTGAVFNDGARLQRKARKAAREGTPIHVEAPLKLGDTLIKLEFIDGRQEEFICDGQGGGEWKVKK